MAYQGNGPMKEDIYAKTKPWGNTSFIFKMIR